MAPAGVVLPATLDDANIHIESADTKNKWRTLWGMKRYCVWILYLTLGTVMQGYDFSIFGTLLAYQTFSKKYGFFDHTTQSYIVSSGHQAAWNASSTSCQVIGGIISGVIMDRIGRKLFYLISGCIGTLGIGIIYYAPDWKVFAVGRALLGLAIGCIGTFSPLYIGENSVPELRGFFLVSFNSFIVVGQFILSLVARGMVSVNSDWQFKGLILTMLTFNVILILGWPFMPESPYWLLSKKNDREAARKSFRKLYGPGKDDFIEAEIVRLEINITTSNALWNMEDGKPRLSEAFKGVNLQRTLCAFLAAAAQMFCGVIFVVGYFTYFLTLAGVSDAFNWNMYLFLVNLLANIASFYTVERFGRRNFIVYGLAVMAIVNLIIGGLNVHPTTTKLYATVGLTYVWAAAYQMSIGAIGFVFASEVGSLPLRQITQSIVTMSNAGWSWVFVFSIPYMINPDAGNLGGKIGFIFGGLGVFTFIMAFFMFPETKGLTFSELDYLFASKTSPRHFSSTIAQRRAEGIVEETVHHRMKGPVDPDAKTPVSQHFEAPNHEA